MSKNLEIARQFFEACETGKGWSGCKPYCHPGATFSAQAKAIADIKALAAYTEWMKDLLTPIPDGHYQLRSFSEDEARQCVTAFAVFHGTQTGPGGADGKINCRGLCLRHGVRGWPYQAYD